MGVEADGCTAATRGSRLAVLAGLETSEEGRSEVLVAVVVRRSLEGGWTSPVPESLPGEGVGQKVTTLTRFLDVVVATTVEDEEEEVELELSLRPPLRLSCPNRSFGREFREANVR